MRMAIAYHVSAMKMSCTGQVPIDLSEDALPQTLSAAKSLLLPQVTAQLRATLGMPFHSVDKIEIVYEGREIGSEDEWQHLLQRAKSCDRVAQECFLNVSDEPARE